METPDYILQHYKCMQNYVAYYRSKGIKVENEDDYKKLAYDIPKNIRITNCPCSHGWEFNTQIETIYKYYGIKFSWEEFLKH